MADNSRGHRGGGRGGNFRGGGRGGGGHRGGGGRSGGGHGGHQHNQAQGGDGERGERPKKENILDLSKYNNKRITVKFNGGREGKLNYSLAYVPPSLLPTTHTKKVLTSKRI